MAAKKRKKDVFSVVKAVKSNARDRVGQPKPARVIEDKTRAGRRKEDLKNLLDDQPGSPD